MHNILYKIIESKKKEIEVFKENVSFEEILKKLPNIQSTFSQILDPKNGLIGIIAEIKMKSPSDGEIISSDSIDILEKTKKIAEEYEDANVDAISIVTDEKYFSGSISMIEEVKNIVTAPLFQKDFIIDPMQIYNSKLVGSDAILLIARILDQKKLSEFAALCFEIGIEPVVEVYDEDDLEKALQTSVKFIGVNARDLSSFEINIENACRIGKMIPSDRVFIGFSGIKNHEDVLKYKNVGAKAVLVGTNLLKVKDKKRFIQDLIKYDKS